MSDEAITDAELAEWKRVTDAATVGPWQLCGCGHCSSVFTADGQAYVHIQPGPDVDPSTRKPNEDAAFIAASRAALPRLLAEVERLRTENSALFEKWSFSSTDLGALQHDSEEWFAKAGRVDDAEAEVERLKRDLADAKAALGEPNR